MRTLVSRLIHSRSSLPRLYTTGVSNSGRYLSTESNKVDGPFKVEEAETVNISPPPAEKLLVLGGNGFVGSHVCKEAVDCGLSVASLSRSGRSSIQDSWASNVTWHQGNLLSPGSWEDALNGVTSVISCVGGFGSNSYMYKINGTANINAIRAASEKGVKRFVCISAADFGVANYLLQGYYEGKRAAEAELLIKFPYGGVILRPGFIYGTRRVGSMKLPLGVIGSPLEARQQGGGGSEVLWGIGISVERITAAPASAVCPQFQTVNPGLRLGLSSNVLAWLVQSEDSAKGKPHIPPNQPGCREPLQLQLCSLFLDLNPFAPTSKQEAHC